MGSVGISGGTVVGSTGGSVGLSTTGFGSVVGSG